MFKFVASFDSCLRITEKHFQREAIVTLPVCQVYTNSVVFIYLVLYRVWPQIQSTYR